MHEGRFQSFDGQDFFTLQWEPPGETRANLVLIHGYGEHCARYDRVARHMNEAGFRVFSFDQRGHGRSPGRRGYIANFDDFLRDLAAYFAHLEPRFGPAPRFIMAHSMGGLVFASYLRDHAVPARGYVFSGAFLEMKDVSPILLAVAGVLSALTPWLPVATLDSTAVSRDPEEVRKYQNDPLVYHGKINARTGAELNRAVAAVKPALARIQTPLYIIHGEKDRLVPASASRLLNASAASPDKTLQIYEGGYHELFNDLPREEVLNGIRNWLLARL